MITFTWGGKTTGSLSPGCIQCIQGRKSVLFITGHCNLSCYYCPVSSKKMYQGHMYINETFIPETMAIEQAITIIKQEITLCQSRGISITGGDPLLAPERIFSIGQALKKEFGSDFHIHLYTPGRDGSEDIFAKISKVIDEIRFHPTSKKDLTMMVKALEIPTWDVGLELPATINLSQNTFFKKILETYYKESKKRERKRIFMNLNELEITESNFRNMTNFISEDNLLESVVSGSTQEANKIQTQVLDMYPNFDVFFCPQREKDAVQLPKRYELRAASVAFMGDIIEPEGSNKGLLMRGVIKFDNSQKHDGFYLLLKLEDLKKRILTQLDLDEELIIVDYRKSRLLTSPELVDQYTDEIHKILPSLEVSILEESPTADQIEFSRFSL